MQLSSAKKPIVLIGMMGSGKSTIGKMLAVHLNEVFIDTDAFIEKKYGKTIAQLFAEEGEKTFRKYETEALKELLLSTPTYGVIATGGGIVLAPENRELLKTHADTIWLKTSAQTILNRILVDKTIRPLLADADKEKTIAALLAAREPYYQEATTHIDTDQNTPEEVVNIIALGGAF